MDNLAPNIIAQLNLLDSTIGFVSVVAITFIFITLVTSVIRFQDILELLDSNIKVQEDDQINVLKIRLAKFITESGRDQQVFCVAKVGVPKQISTSEIHTKWSEVLRKSDAIVKYQKDTLYLLIRCERSEFQPILDRLLDIYKTSNSGIWIIGCASYPDDGVSGNKLLEASDLAQKKSSENECFQWFKESENELDSSEEIAENSSTNDKLLDPLTGVLREGVLSTFMHRHLNECRIKKEPVALFSISIDNMRYISSFHGKEAYDYLIAEISKEIQSCLRSSDMIGRHDENGFLTLIKCDAHQSESLAQRLCGIIQKKICLFNGVKMRTTATIGISVYPNHGRNLHQLYTKAERVVSYCRINDIRGYAYFDEKLH